MIIPELRPPAKPHIIIGSIDSGQPCKCYIGEDHEVDPYVAFGWTVSRDPELQSPPVVLPVAVERGQG